MGWSPCALQLRQRDRGPRDCTVSFGAALLPPSARKLPCLRTEACPGRPLTSPSTQPFYSPSPSCHWVTVWGAGPSPCSSSLPRRSLAPGLWERALPACSQYPAWYSQLPLVVAVQERVGGGPYCKVTAACVHQDVELSERRERKMLGQEAWTHSLCCSVLYSPPTPATWSSFGVSRVKLPDAGLDRLAPVSTRTTDTEASCDSLRTASEALCLLLSSLQNWNVFCVIRATALARACFHPCFCHQMPFLTLGSGPACLQSSPLPLTSGSRGTSPAGSLAHPPPGSETSYSRSWHWPGALWVPGWHRETTCF